ncbi:MAG: glycosyltransferase [Planctomycetes bacterium]|nr:glycosyltransferase [Planctomycetota bacterium]
MCRTLGVFAKEPRPGQVKTRLAAALSPDGAAHVADAFLRDTLRRMAAVRAERFLVFSPTSAAAYFQSLAADCYALAPQGDGDLGQRLQRFVDGRLDSGSRHVVVIGTDSPTLPTAFVDQAFDELDRADVVLGPATDGGYYLIGLRRSSAVIFQGIDWGAAAVLAQTIARLPRECRLSLLPPWYDIDSETDWEMLRGHVAAIRRAGGDPLIPDTERLLSRLPTAAAPGSS